MLNSFQHLLTLQIPTFVGMTASMKKCVMLMLRRGKSASKAEWIDFVCCGESVRMTFFFGVVSG
jgi:hypothetical protein